MLLKTIVENFYASFLRKFICTEVVCVVVAIFGASSTPVYAQTLMDMMKENDYRTEKTLAEVDNQTKLIIRDAEDFKQWQDGVCGNVDIKAKAVHTLELKQKFIAEFTALKQILGDDIETMRNRVETAESFINNRCQKSESGLDPSCYGALSDIELQKGFVNGAMKLLQAEKISSVHIYNAFFCLERTEKEYPTDLLKEMTDHTYTRWADFRDELTHAIDMLDKASTVLVKR